MQSIRNEFLHIEFEEHQALDEMMVLFKGR